MLDNSAISRKKKISQTNSRTPNWFVEFACQVDNLASSKSTISNSNRETTRQSRVWHHPSTATYATYVGNDYCHTDNADLLQKFLLTCIPNNRHVTNTPCAAYTCFCILLLTRHRPRTLRYVPEPRANHYWPRTLHELRQRLRYLHYVPEPADNYVYWLWNLHPSGQCNC